MMKKILLIFCLIVAVALSNGYAEETIRIANNEWPPFHSEFLEHYGVASRIVKEAFMLEGIKVVYDFFSYKRALFLVKIGEWDGSLAWIYSEERAQFALFSKPIAINQQVFFYQKNSNFRWNAFNELIGKSVGIVNIEAHVPKILQMEKSGNLHIERVKDEEINFRKLLGGRIQLALLSLDPGYHLLHRHFNPSQIKTITHHPKVVSEKPLHLILSKKKPRNQYLLKVFNKGLQRLKTSGKYDLYYKESRRGDYLIKK